MKIICGRRKERIHRNYEFYLQRKIAPKKKKNYHAKGFWKHETLTLMYQSSQSLRSQYRLNERDQSSAARKTVFSSVFLWSLDTEVAPWGSPKCWDLAIDTSYSSLCFDDQC